VVPAQILSIQTGKAARFRGADEPSAIAKQPRNGPVAIGPLGLVGDEQADLTVHGGADKAIHHYPFDHYPVWRSEIGDHRLLGSAGGFGENISTLGMLESEVCIGDRFRLGTALVELSQGRQPCWKIDHHFGRKGMTARVVETRRSGWYYRMIEPGKVQAGDSIALLDRPQGEWNVARVFALLIAGRGRQDPAALRALAGMEVLAPAWRSKAQATLAQLP
jgi:MOSC domain-containing protein YiiM